MKNIFLLLFFSLSCLVCCGQVNGDVYGVYGNLNHATNQFSFGFCTIDISTGTISRKNMIPTNIHYQYFQNSLDSKHKKLYCITTDSVNMYLMQFDLLSGNIDTVLFEIDSLNDGTSAFLTSNISSVFYNCYDNSVYFLYWIPGRDSLGPTVDSLMLAKINMASGLFTNVTKFTDKFFYGYDQFVDCSHQKIFLFESNRLGTLFTYDLLTNTLTAGQLNRNYDFRNCNLKLKLNPLDNQLYGLECEIVVLNNIAIYKSRVIKINPENGIVTDLSQVYDLKSLNNIVYNLTFDNIYFICGNNMDSVAIFNIANNNLTFSYLHSSENDFLLSCLGVYDISLPDTNYTIANFCQNAPTSFHAQNNSTSRQWDFGDPQAGNYNFSDLVNPVHVYNSPGIYDVTMIASTCTATDTIEKQIVINPFPEIDVGSDTSVCINRNLLPVTFTADAPFSYYLWQDSSTSNSFSTREPGTFWVRVSSSCGIVIDTATINGVECSCGIFLNPNLASEIVSVHVDCDLSQYSNPQLELFDELGREIISEKVVENNFHINLQEFANGVYFFRFRDGSTKIKSGKIIVSE